MAMDIVQFPSNKLIHIIADMLESMLQANSGMIPSSQITHFDSRTIPTISLAAYLQRLQRYAHFSNEALLSMLIYFDRISSSGSNTNSSDNTFFIHSYNVHRLIIASLVVASKFTSDVYYTNSRYAKVGGISVAELNQLELEFLFLINFRLHIKVRKLQSFADQLLLHSQQQQQQHHEPDINTNYQQFHNGTTKHSMAASTVSVSSGNQSVASPRSSSSSPASTAIVKEIVLPLTPPPCDSTAGTLQTHLYHQQQQERVLTSNKRKRSDSLNNDSRENKKATTSILNAGTANNPKHLIDPSTLSITVGVISPKEKYT